jgi:hypothetical protein
MAQSLSMRAKHAKAMSGLVVTLSLLSPVARAVEVQASSQEATPSPCCGAAIVRAGHLEVEFTHTSDLRDDANAHGGGLTLKYSLTDRLQVQVATASLYVASAELTAHLLDGAIVGAKWLLLAEDAFPLLALEAHLLVPTLAGSTAVQTTVDAVAMVDASADLAGLQLDLNLAMTVGDLGGLPFVQGSASLGAGWTLAPAWTLSTGPWSTFGGGERAPLDGGWCLGLTFNPIAELALMVGAEVAFFRQERWASVQVGFAWVPRLRTAGG